MIGWDGRAMASPLGSCSSWGPAGDAGKDHWSYLVAAAATMSRVSVPCHVKGTVALQVGDVRTSQGRPGVLVIDVTFPSVAPFEVSKQVGATGAPGRGLSGNSGVSQPFNRLLKASAVVPRPNESVKHLFLPSVNTQLLECSFLFCSLQRLSPMPRMALTRKCRDSRLGAGNTVLNLIEVRGRFVPGH